MLHKAYILSITVALLFLSFVAGYSASHFSLLGNSFLHDAMLAARSVYFQATAYGNQYKSTRWNRVNYTDTGLVTHDPEKSWPGYTLYTSGHDTAAMLIDINGQQQWRWSFPFHDAWPKANHLKYAAPEQSMYWRKAIVYPNGDLLAIYDGEGVTPSGHGLIKVDKDSNLLWKFSDSTHHDVRFSQDGRIYTLTNKFKQEPLPGVPDLLPPLLLDDVVILDSAGNELDRIDVADAINKSKYRKLLAGATPNKLGDHFHTNTVQPLSKEISAAFDFAEEGQILICLRELSAIVLLDPIEKKVVWAMRGPWIGQHDAEMLANGNILIFDNKGNFSRDAGVSRILEFDPHTLAIQWKYTGNLDSLFSVDIRGSQQRLPNGNTLITASTQGSLFEVTPENEIVWRFNNPARSGEPDDYVAIILWGQRYSASELPFLN